jgi:phosphoribosylformylglycinamidine cyclo-ligase
MINVVGMLKAAAHITGGGIPENLLRVLPRGHQAVVEFSAWDKQPIFDWIKRISGNNRTEMLRTFNMGIGLIIVVRKDVADDCLTHLNIGFGEKAWIIGEIIKGRRSVVIS